MKLTLVDIYGEDGPHVSFERMLYDLLKQRDMRYALSHEEIPTYAAHHAFVAGKPYKAWYIIFDRDLSDYVGAIYLTERNEIGVHIRKQHQRKGIGTWAVEELMRIHGKLRYFANIHPDNLGARAFLERQGFGDKPFQVTLSKDLRDA